MKMGCIAQESAECVFHRHMRSPESALRVLERQRWGETCALWGKGRHRWASWQTLIKACYVLSFRASDHKRENWRKTDCLDECYVYKKGIRLFLEYRENEYIYSYFSSAIRTSIEQKLIGFSTRKCARGLQDVVETWLV